MDLRFKLPGQFNHKALKGKFPQDKNILQMTSITHYCFPAGLQFYIKQASNILVSISCSHNLRSCGVLFIADDNESIHCLFMFVRLIFIGPSGIIWVTACITSEYTSSNKLENMSYHLLPVTCIQHTPSLTDKRRKML